MKKFNKFGFASAIVLAGAMGFAACSSDDEEFVELNPTFDGNSVKTQFAISLTQKANKGGRMSIAQTQAEGKFQGMKNIHLYHFNSSAISEATTNVGLSTLAAFDAPDYQNSAKNLNAKYYQNVAIETGVNHFLFYGQTSNDTITDDKYTKATYAKLNESVETTKFEPVTIISSEKTADFEEAKEDLVDKWDAIYALFTNNALPLSIQNYKAVIENMAAGGSASSNSMFALVKDIYNDIKIQYDGMPAGDPKTETSDLMSDLLTTAGMKISDTDGSIVWTTNPEFPTTFGVPEGAMALAWDDANTKVSIDTQYNLNESDEIETYVYPASLFYYVNTPAGIKNQTYFTTGAKNERDWNSLATTEYNQGAISAVTRSVILWDQVQYGVARLETTVKLGSNIEDSKQAAVNTTSFKVTGILVASQKPVDWQFKPFGTEEYVIWDKNLSGEMAAQSTAKGINHTLVYETASDKAVNVAVELLNEGDDFYGVNGKVVRKGTKFYVVAKLDPNAATGVTKPTGGADIDQVFKQDYVTKANLTIPSLAKAYNVIPNLEQSNLEFGMSVNLEWETGLQFDVNVQ